MGAGPITLTMQVVGAGAIPQAMQANASAVEAAAAKIKAQLDAQSAASLKARESVLQVAKSYNELRSEMAASQVITQQQYQQEQALQKQLTDTGLAAGMNAKQIQNLATQEGYAAAETSLLKAQYAALQVQFKAAQTTAAALAKEEAAVAAATAEAAAAAEAAVLAEQQLAEENAKVAFSSNAARMSAMGMSQEFGLHIPRALTSFLSKSETIGPLLANAFSVVAVVAMVEVLGMAASKIKEVTAAMMGWDEAAKKTYQDIKSGSEAAIAQTRQLAKAMDEVPLVGKAGIPKAQGSLQVTQKELERIAVDGAAAAKKVRDLTTELESLGSIKQPSDVFNPFLLNQMIEKRISPTTRPKSEVEDDLRAAQKAEAELAVLQRTAQVEVKKQTEELSVAERESALKSAELHNRINLERLKGVEDEVKREYELRQISYDQLVSAEQVVEQRRLAITKKGLEDRQKYSGGGITSGELALQETEAKAASDNKLAQAATAAALHRQQVETTTAHAIIEADKAVAEARIAIDKERIASILQDSTVSAEEQKRLLKSIVTAELSAKETELSQLFALAERAGEQGIAEQIKIGGQLAALRAEQAAKMAAVDVAVDKKEAADFKQRLEDETRFAIQAANEQLREDAVLSESKLKRGQITLRQWEQDQKAAIERWYAAERKRLEDSSAIAGLVYGTESRLYRQMIAEMERLDKEHAIKVMTLDEQVMGKWKQVTQAMASEMSRTLTGVLTGHTTFTKGMIDLYDQMATRIIQSLIQVGIQWLLQWALQQTLMEQQKVALAKDAARKAYDATVGIPYIGPIIAPVAAAGAFAAMMAFEKGGIVPDDDVAMLHKNEMVLPAPISQTIQNMVASGGSGGGGDVHGHAHFHGPVYGDGSGIASEVRKSTKQVAKEIRRMQRYGHLGVRT